MRFILSALLICSIQFLHGQELLKVKVQEPPEQTQVAWKDSANVLIAAFDSAKNYISLQQLIDFFKRKEVTEDTAFMRAADSLIRLIDSATRNNSVMLPLFGTDGKTIKVEKTEGGTCSELAKVVSIVMRKNTEGEFEVSFADKNDNPVAGFIIRQLNEAFFYDKISQSLYGLCTGTVAKSDSGKVNSLIADFKKKGLYQHMLEAGLEVNDDDVFAGKLTIRKEVSVIAKRKDNSNAQRSTGKSSVVFARLDEPGGTGEKETIINEEKDPGKQSWLIAWSPAPVVMDGSADRAIIGSSGKPGTYNDTLVFTVHDVQIQFQDGFIENIKIRGKIAESNMLLKFENSFPIPFSTRRDFRRLYEVFLTERTIFERKEKNGLGISSLSMRLGDLMDFDQNLDLDTKDYSPVNQVINQEIKKDETIVNLRKERTSKILELKVFTDLKGIEGDNPNGLVQLELSKKLNLWNYRFSAFRNLFNMGLFNYFSPSFTMSKIENNNKRLPVQYIGSQEPDTMRPNTYASALQLLQYQAFRVGADISILTVDVPGLKSIFTAKTGLYFGRTLIVDTARTRADSLTFNAIPDNNIRESGINSFQFIPELCFQIFPDKRYGVVLSYKWNRYRLMNSQLQQVNDTLEYVNYIKSLNGNRSGISGYKPNKWVGTAEVFAFYKPSANNQLFFRYRFNYEKNRPKTNFHQIQLGFSTYLTHTSKGKKEKEAERND